MQAGIATDHPVPDPKFGWCGMRCVVGSQRPQSSHTACVSAIIALLDASFISSIVICFSNLRCCRFNSHCKVFWRRCSLLNPSGISLTNRGWGACRIRTRAAMIAPADSGLKAPPRAFLAATLGLVILRRCARQFQKVLSSSHCVSKSSTRYVGLLFFFATGAIKGPGWE